MRPSKTQPLGVCDLCLSQIPRSDWYTSKGRARLHCCLDCKNTANSRAGSQIRSKKARERVAAGTWQNPATLHPPDPVNVGAGVRRVRLAEVHAGAWRNPALTPEARAKLSTPRQHTGDLANAIERLKAGAAVSDLTPDEQQAHREYRRRLRLARRVAVNRAARARYAAQQAALTPEEREQQRERWRAANRRKPAT